MFLKSLDLSNFSLGFEIQNNQKMTTIFGGFLTIVILFLSLLCFLAFGMDLVSRKKQIVVMADSLNEDLITKREDYEIAIGVSMNAGVPINGYDRKLEFKISHVDIDGVNRKGNNTTIYNHYKMEKCDTRKDLKKSGELKKFQKEFILPSNFYYCLPNNYTKNLTNSFGQSKSEVLILSISLCKENKLLLENGEVTCSPIKELKQEFNILFFQILWKSNFINSNDYINPVKNNIDSKSLRISGFSLRYDIWYFKLIEYMSDDGLILENETNYKGFAVSGYDSDSFYNPEGLEIVRILFTNDRMKIKYQRTYLKLQKVAADIGGIVKFFSLILFFIGNQYASLKFLDFATLEFIKNIKTSTDFIPPESSSLKIFENKENQNQNELKIVDKISSINENIDKIKYEINSKSIELTNFDKMQCSKNANQIKLNSLPFNLSSKVNSLLETYSWNFVSILKFNFGCINDTNSRILKATQNLIKLKIDIFSYFYNMQEKECLKKIIFDFDVNQIEIFNKISRGNLIEKFEAK